MKPCMYCAQPTTGRCPECGAACCPPCGVGRCPVCVRIQRFYARRAMARRLVPWQTLDIAVMSPVRLFLSDPQATQLITVELPEVR